MAPLTWRNVAAPDFSPAASILDTAARSWNNAASGIGDALTELGGIRSQVQSAPALAILAKVANEQGVNPAINQVTGMVPAHNRSPELLQAMASLRGEALKAERSRALTEGTQANTSYTRDTNARAAENHRRETTAEDQWNRMAAEIARERENRLYGPASNNVSPEFAQHVPGIFAGEGTNGDYDTLFNNAQREGAAFAGTKLTNMTVDEALAFADPSGEYGQYVAARNDGTVATPLGAYQVVGSTLAKAKEGLGLKGDEKMTAELQDQIGEWIFQNQGLGAWAGYKPGVSGSANAGGGDPRRITDDLPANSMIPGGQILGLVDSNREWNEATTKRQRDEWGDDYVARNWRSWTRGPEQALMSIENDPNLNREQKAVARRKAGEMFANEGFRFTPPPGSTSPTVKKWDRVFDQVLDVTENYAQAEAFQDQGPAAELTRGAPGSGAGGSAGGQQGDAGGGPVGSGVPNAGDLAGDVTQVTTRLKEAGVNVNHPEVIKTVNRMRQETGLSREAVLGAMLNSLDESWWNYVPFVGDTAVVDEDRLRGMLANLTPQAIRQHAETRRGRTEAFERVEEGKAEFELLRRELANIQWQKTPESQARVKEIEARLEQLRAGMVAANKTIADSYGISEDAPESETGPGAQAAETGNQGPGARVLAKAVQEGADKPTPAGNKVDPSSSPFQQRVDQALRNVEISDGLIEAQNKIWDQGHPGGLPGAAQSVGDFFTARTPEEREQLELRRNVVDEALEWFQSTEARAMMHKNPGLLAEVRADPLAFFIEHKKPSLKGKVRTIQPREPRRWNGAPAGAMATPLPGDAR